jgi:hypothetical protein
MKKTIRLTEDDLTRIVKRVIEASEVMPKTDPMMGYIKSVIDSMPELKVGQYCSSGKFNLPKLEREHMGDLQKVFGDQTNEIVSSYKNKLSTMDSESLLSLIKTLKSLITKPDEFISYLKNFLGMKSKTPVNEMLSPIFLVVFGIILLWALIDFMRGKNLAGICYFY